MKDGLRFNEPMSKHTTFETGGPAEIYCAPSDSEELADVLLAVRQASAACFILGGGANLLVSDKGIPGLVIDMKNFSSNNISPDGLASLGSGLIVDRAAEAALEAGFSGLDSFYGMPGTIGGAVWMNARCYGRSVSDILISVDYLDADLSFKSMDINPGVFDYKKSPFQEMNAVILNAVFKLEPDNRQDIKNRMAEHKKDREDKGHYAGPSAGSVFKNNRDFGKPSGAIIDSLGLRGTAIGGAKISDQHANIFINTGNATSSDIHALISLTVEKVREAYGITLEPEVQFIGLF